MNKWEAKNLVQRQELEQLAEQMEQRNQKRMERMLTVIRNSRKAEARRLEKLEQKLTNLLEYMQTFNAEQWSQFLKENEKRDALAAERSQEIMTLIKMLLLNSLSDEVENGLEDKNIRSRILKK